MRKENIHHLFSQLLHDVVSNFHLSITDLIQHLVLTSSITSMLTRFLKTRLQQDIKTRFHMVFSITRLFLAHKNCSYKSLFHCGRCNIIILCPRTRRTTGEQTHLSWKVQSHSFQPSIFLLTGTMKPFSPLSFFLLFF